MKTANGEQTQYRHSHIHTQDQPGINIDIAKELEERFTWVPLLIAQPNEDLAGLEVISLDEVDTSFSAFKQVAVEGEAHESVSSKGVVEDDVYSFEELDQVDKGLALQGASKMIEVVDHNQQDDGGWDTTVLMSLNGLNIHSMS